MKEEEKENEEWGKVAMLIVKFERFYIHLYTDIYMQTHTHIRYI